MIGMDIGAAFQILELPAGATLEDVSVSFRRLLKLYHPDRNLDRSEWSHRKTVQLTQAYEAASDYLRACPPNPGTATATQTDTGPRKAEEPEYTAPAGEQGPSVGYSVSLQLRLAGEFDLLLDQLYAYYSFGLDNVHLRTEGSLRYRYRNTLRRLHKVVAGLQELLQWPGSSVQYEQVEVVHRFAAAFYENMLIKAQEHHVPTGDERKAYRLYRQGAEMLDTAIKTRLFDEFSKDGSSSSSRSLSERSLMLLMAQYPRSRYTAETLIKYYLLEAFGRLCQVIDEG
ncbi:MAG: J domain-containing protein [Alkalispirochaeta sp.]